MERIPETVIRAAHSHFLNGAEFPCSASAMREAIEYALMEIGMLPKEENPYRVIARRLAKLMSKAIEESEIVTLGQDPNDELDVGSFAYHVYALSEDSCDEISAILAEPIVIELLGPRRKLTKSLESS